MVKTETKVTLIPISKIYADVNQPRQEFEPAGMKRLEESIKKQGVLNPVVVERKSDGRYMLLDGERRYRAAKHVGEDKLPSIIHEEMSDLERLAIRFHLQEQHAHWSAFDKARAISQLQASTGLSNAEIADMLGLPVKAVQDFTLLLRFSKRSLQFAADKRIPYALFSDFAPVLTRFEKSSLRDKIEQAFVKKIENGTISNKVIVAKYSAALKPENEKVVKNFISDEDFTPTEAIEMAHASDAFLLRTVRHTVARATSAIREATKAKAYKGADTKEFQVLTTASKEIDKFLRLIGHVDEK